MHFSLLLGLGGALLAVARPLGSDSTVNLPRSLPQCANDAVWLQFQESPLQAQASAFCSAYIEQTATQVVTVYPTTTRTATITDATVDITVTDTSNVIDTVTLWYSSSDIVPVTITSVIEDVVPTTDFITTTDATAISTSTDVVTTTVTDATLTSTVVSTDDITTTDTTIYATSTATLSMTITDATVTNTVTSFHTVTTTASLVQKREVEIQEDDQEYDSCPAPEPECTSSECLYSSWLDEVSTIATSDLSSACSCLVVPATTTSTIVVTGSQATRTIAPSIFVTATSRVTAVQSRASSHVVSATTILEKTSSSSLFVTQTVTSPTTKYVHATASSSAIVTRVATDDKTASTTITSIESITIDETASATTTITATATIHETASTTISTTETRTATVSPTACAQLPNPYHDTSTGRTYELQCGYEYSYSASKIVSIVDYVTFLGCITACSEYSACEYVQYDRNEEGCWLLSAVTGGQAESVVDVAYVVSA